MARETGFLVLSREIDQDIVIIAPDGAELVIRNIAVRLGGKVRIGVRAPREYAVHRREIADRIERQRRAAAVTP